MDAPAKPFIEKPTMTSEDRATQTKVGIFIFIGLLVVGAMVVYFGRLGEGVKEYYNLRVEFPNASGLMRGSEVLLAGAKIGRVTQDPVILPDMEGVYVELRIFSDVKIPTASEFSVGSSGLLGDRFVQIVLKKDAKSAPPIEPGSTIKGLPEGGGFGGIASSAEELLTEVRGAVAKINSVADKIDSGVLSAEGIESISATLKNLKTTSERLAESTAGVDKVVADAGQAVEASKTTMGAATKAAQELEKTLSDIRGLVREVKQGQGALGMMLTNREVADNLRALVVNLRRHGILWYRDGEKGRQPPADR